MLWQWFKKCAYLFCTYPKWHFQIFSSPNIHALIIWTNFIKIISINREKTTGYGRRMKRLWSITSTTVHLPLRNTIPMIRCYFSSSIFNHEYRKLYSDRNNSRYLYLRRHTNESWASSWSLPTSCLKRWRIQRYHQISRRWLDIPQPSYLGQFHSIRVLTIPRCIRNVHQEM